MRPVLSPAARRLWRDPETLQLGREPDRAVVLAGLDAESQAVLPLLDGTRDVPGVLRDAVQLGCPARRVEELLDLLQQAGVLLDAADRWPDRLRRHERDRLTADVASLGLVHGDGGLPALRRRDAAAVVVLGGGRVGAPLAALLAAAGVGTVDVVDDGAARPVDTAVGGLDLSDVGRRRGEAARERLLAAAPTTCTGPVVRPDVVVLAPPGLLDALDVATLQRDAVPHLLAEVSETVGVVGPLVLPGSSACLHCLELTRTDQDPDWPTLATQLAGRPGVPAPCDSALAAAVVAQCALQVLTLVDGGAPASLEGTLELALPEWRWRRRTWRPHPACECRWQTGERGAGRAAG